MQNYDLIIIGGGPGGYVAAIRAAQLGKKVGVIESTHLGGICLNWGCIPTKALLKNADVLSTIRAAGKFGIDIPEHTVNWTKIVKRSRDISKKLTRGIEFLFKKNKVDWILGYGRLIAKNRVSCENENGEVTEFSARHIIIATGARPRYFPGMEPDGKQVITSREAMVLDDIPESLAIIGAGAIGVEFAHIYYTFGSKVTLIEALPNILPVEDQDVSRELERIFRKQKIDIRTSSLVKKIDRLENRVVIHLNEGDPIEAEKALIAVGVKGNIEDIGLEENGITVENGWIRVNEYMQTSLADVYAIGDVAGPPWLAHVASAEGIVAVEHLAGQDPTRMSYDNIPGCTYCHPEVASVGMTEQQAVDSGAALKIGRFPFRGLGKSAAMNEPDGFVKAIYDADSGEMLGCHIIGAEATNLISEAAIARTLETTYMEILKTIHPHPTLSEAVMEATADALGEAIHI